MKKMWLGALMLAVGSVAFAQEKKQEFDVKRHHWAKYGAGASVTFTMNIDAQGQAMAGTYTQTLKEVGKGNYTVTTAIEVGGQVQESEEVEEFPTHAGEETLKVAGKEYKCTVWTSKSTRNSVEMTTKMWLTESVKTPLKLEINDGSETCVVLAVKIGEKVSAAGKDYECTVLDGELPTEMGKAKAKLWMHHDLPGMTVKIELEMGGDMGAMKLSLELKEFNVSK